MRGAAAILTVISGVFYRFAYPAQVLTKYFTAQMVFLMALLSIMALMNILSHSEPPYFNLQSDNFTNLNPLAFISGITSITASVELLPGLFMCNIKMAPGFA